MKSGNLNFLEPSGPLQACNGTALPSRRSLAVNVKVVYQPPSTRPFAYSSYPQFIIAVSLILRHNISVKAKAVPLPSWSVQEGSSKLRFPYFMTTAQVGGEVVSLTHQLPLPPGNTPGTHFCERLSRPQGHSATGKIMSLKNSNDIIRNRTRDLAVCSVVP